MTIQFANTPTANPALIISIAASVILFIKGNNWEFAGQLTFFGYSDKIIMNIATSLKINQNSSLKLSFYNSAGLPEGYFKPMAAVTSWNISYHIRGGGVK